MILDRGYYIFKKGGKVNVQEIYEKWYLVINRKLEPIYVCTLVSGKVREKNKIQILGQFIALYHHSADVVYRNRKLLNLIFILFPAKRFRARPITLIIP